MFSLKRLWLVFWNACRTFVKIDGELRAASFSYYAFFSLFPLVLLVVTIGSTFLPPEIPKRMLAAIETYVTLSATDEQVVKQTLEGVIASRGKVSLLALFGLAWGAMRFFQALVIGINRAWGKRDYCWVSLSLKNLAIICILTSALLLGAIVPMILDMAGSFARFRGEWLTNLYNFGRALVPSLVLFYGFLMLYRFAPRHKTTFDQVWPSALLVTVAIQVFQRLFVFYAYKLANFNAVYGALGAVLILLMWIYITGMVIIFGGCLCASAAKFPRRPVHKKVTPRLSAKAESRPKQTTLFDT